MKEEPPKTARAHDEHPVHGATIVELDRGELRDTDVDDLRTLLQQLSPGTRWRDASDEEVLDEVMVPHGYTCVVRDTLGDSQHIVATGRVSFTERADEGYIDNVVVHADRRGQGLGRAVMEHVIAIARARGMHTLTLTSNSERTAAHSLYNSLGFEIVDERQKYDKEGNPTHTTNVFELDLNTFRSADKTERLNRSGMKKRSQ